MNPNSLSFKVGFLVLPLFFLAACGAATEPKANPSSDATGSSANLASTKEPTEPEDFNWTIVVKDSSTISIGPMKMDFTIDLNAVNTTGKIDGPYTGSATTKAVSHAENVAIKKGTGSINAPVEGKSTSLSFNISPYVSDEDKLAPLVPEEPDDGKLAPLVPNDDEKLAPLTDPKDQPEYEGEGTMVLQSSGTATGTVRGVSASKGIGNTSTNRLKFTIKGTQVRLEVTIPEIGPVYFNGFIRGEGRK